MVGKGIETKSSRIFHQCYVKCCKLQNLTPLNNVIPSANGRVLDFCVDRIRYVDWPPILNALSCDLSLHSVVIKCRQQVKTVLEHVDCERLAKTVNNRCVILTNFMLSNLVEAIAQLLSNTTLLSSLTLEGLPLKIPYLNPLCEALWQCDCLQHLCLPRCMIGDAGCIAICKSIRCLPNILTLDLSGCELTAVGAAHIADLIKYQKLQRYSDNWRHTLRYRLPELDAMAGLRRLTLCANTHLADAGLVALLDVLADDLWIKALDVQGCGVTEAGAASALRMLRSNTTLEVLDMRHNVAVCADTLANLRAALRDRRTAQFTWLTSVSSGSSDKLTKPTVNKHAPAPAKDHILPNVKSQPIKNVNANIVKKDKDYVELLEEQLQEEMSHRRQLEELNVQLAEQMRQLKEQRVRAWSECAASSDSARSLSMESRSSCSVHIEQSTLEYVQRAFSDIYTYIKNNQCNGACGRRVARLSLAKRRVSASARSRTTRSAHLLRATQRPDTKPMMFERRMGDTVSAHDQQTLVKCHKSDAVAAVGVADECSPSSSVSSDTLVCERPAPRCALLSDTDEESSA